MSDMFEKKPAPASKSKAVLIIPIIVVVLGLAGYLGYNSYTSQKKEQAVASFIFLMDKIFGQDKWSAESYDFSLSEKTLTANKVSVKPETPESSTDSGSIEASQIEIENGLLIDDLTALFAKTDWRSEPDTHLANRLTLRKIDFKAKLGDDDYNLLVDELNVTGLDLVAAGADNPAGLLGFLKSGRIGAVALSALSFQGNMKNWPVDFKIGQIDNTDIRIDPKLANLDNPFEAFTSVTMAQNRLSDISFSTKSPSEPLTAEAKVGLMDVQNKGYLTVGLFKLENANLNIVDNDYDLKIFAEDFSIDKLDVNQLVERLRSIFDKAEAESGPIPDEDKLAEGLAEFNRFSDIFTFPYSFDKAELRNLGFSLNDFKVNFASGKAVGPVEAGKVASLLTYELDGVTVELPTNVDKPLMFELNSMSNFARDFGQNKFVVSYQLTNAYDENEGTYKSTAAPLLKVEELGALSGEIAFSGLTPAFVQQLSEIPMDSRDSFLKLLGTDFTTFALTHLRLQFEDNSFIQKLALYLAARNETDAVSYRANMPNDGQMYMAVALGMARINEAEQIAEAFGDFLAEPQSIAVEVTPSPPLSFMSAIGMADVAAIVESLNATVTVNGQQSIPITYSPPPPLLDNFDDDDLEEDFDEDF
ncbi:MAG: hypothetical protein LBJ64_09815 [Deltaproteobacteria bacterium]|jgi:hypothetical protein|nr:hypothetical protein [Deltaproteobacteria bacterium]